MRHDGSSWRHATPIRVDYKPELASHQLDIYGAVETANGLSACNTIILNKLVRVFIFWSKEKEPSNWRACLQNICLEKLLWN